MKLGDINKEYEMYALIRYRNLFFEQVLHISAHIYTDKVHLTLKEEFYKIKLSDITKPVLFIYVRISRMTEGIK